MARPVALALSVAGCGVSLVVELTQLVRLPDRSATWYDVLANTLAAVPRHGRRCA